MKCEQVGSQLFLRGEKRAIFIRKNYKKVKHAMAHFRDDFSYHAPIYSCQVALIHKFRQTIPYAQTTNIRDLLYRLWKDFIAVEKTRKGKCHPVCLSGLYRDC